MRRATLAIGLAVFLALLTLRTLTGSPFGGAPLWAALLTAIVLGGWVGALVVRSSLRRSH